MADFIISLKNPDKLEAFKALIDSLGYYGILILFLMQYIQIVLSFIPGGPIQILMGVVCGPVGGTILTFAGVIAASISIYYLVRKFGNKILFFFIDESDYKKYSFVNNQKKVKMLLFILFLIPGTPKDMLTYLFFMLTKISLGDFLVITVFARLPAVLVSVIAGENLIDGKWIKLAVNMAVIAITGILGVVINCFIIKKFTNKS